MVMFRSAILVLSFAQLSLVEGAGVSSKPPSAKNVTEIEANSDRRILYGTKAKDKDFPYLVQIQRSMPRVSFCGGAIVDKHWIVTAAHCILGEPCQGIRIIPAGTAGYRRYNASQCLPHPLKRTGKYEYDIALIKVNEDLLQERRYKAVKLPPPGHVFPPGKPFVISGWGRQEDRRYPYNLLSATVPLVTWDKCNKQYLDTERPGAPDMPIRTLCFQGDGPTPPGACYGDSGGPAVTFDNVIAGVSSFVLETGGFCRLGGPSMFTSIVDYLPWIYSHIDPRRDTRNYPVRPEHTFPEHGRV